MSTHHISAIFAASFLVGGLACAPPEPSSSPPDVILSVLSLSLDTKVAPEVPDVEGGYWLTLVAQLENRSDLELPMSFVLFRLTADNGVAVDASVVSEGPSDGCRTGEYVTAGAIASCRLAFVLDHGQLPASLTYRDLELEPLASVGVAICTDPDEPDLCGLECVDLLTDLEHCGECGRTTPMLCVDGEPSCGELTMCDGECVDVSDDFENCGECGREVPSNATCDDGEVMCQPGFEDCGDGTCTDILGNVDHCGMCNNPVPSGAHCAGGESVCTDEGEQVCNDVCLDLSTSQNNCGGCGRTCPAFDEVGTTVFCDEGPTCMIKFATPGGTCDEVCAAFDWTCAYQSGSNVCSCGSSYPAGDCACRCEAPVTEP